MAGRPGRGPDKSGCLAPHCAERGPAPGPHNQGLGRIQQASAATPDPALLRRASSRNSNAGRARLEVTVTACAVPEAPAPHRARTRRAVPHHRGVEVQGHTHGGELRHHRASACPRRDKHGAAGQERTTEQGQGWRVGESAPFGPATFPCSAYILPTNQRTNLTRRGPRVGISAG